MFKRIRIRTNILVHFLFLMLMLAATLIGMQYYFSEQMAKEATTLTFRQSADSIAQKLKDRDRLSKEILYQIENHPSVHIQADATLPMETVRHFLHTLRRYRNMYAIYLGFGNGDFFEVVNMQINRTTHQHFKAPPETRWCIIKIYNNRHGRIREFIFLDDTLHRLGKRSESSTYYATSRTWYREARKTDSPVRSDPYLFSNLKMRGITYAKTVAGTDAVLALDFTLESLNRILSSFRFAQTGGVALFDRNKEVFAASSSVPAALFSEEMPVNAIVNRAHNGKRYYTMILPLTEEMGHETYIGISVERSEMITPYREKIYYALAAGVALMLLFLPLILLFTDHIVQPIRALMRENESIKQRAFEQVKPVRTNIVEFIELSDSQIAMSQSIREYQRQQEELLDAFIKLIADAIDAKSPYTGAHCEKVPVIANMLAEEAEKSTDAPFAGFAFRNDDERTAFQRAAWLHDCGKITTPEYVVDKATKLETIYNRIHEIRTRFEVLWRDIEILYYEKRLQGENEAALKAWKEKEHHKLTEEFALIARCNLGSELMAEADKKKIERIAQRRWKRHFNDRLGLSDEELARYPQKEEMLPVEEKLISDRPEHLIERIGFDAEAYRKEGFKMEVPHYLYNRGELYNLTLEKGTLTPEERYKINEHVVMTIKMLESLPFPEGMREIPKIAGEHHETMDGEGYPRKLTKASLSLPSRMMAIADIFEALTASDRPYKTPKTLSQTLKIMATMAKENHIDADLFRLFVEKKIYLRYANIYLKKAQIDYVEEIPPT